MLIAQVFLTVWLWCSGFYTTSCSVFGNSDRTGVQPQVEPEVHSQTRDWTLRVVVHCGDLVCALDYFLDWSSLRKWGLLWESERVCSLVHFVSRADLPPGLMGFWTLGAELFHSLLWMYGLCWVCWFGSVRFCWDRFCWVLQRVCKGGKWG